MRLNVVILLSVIGYSLGERLQVKCGDELCEKPSNRAVTTLRYTPDKPYKLQINSVNSEVDIFGATDDLFYIRYGRNFGFLPKNHLREKARGNFMHSVEIEIASLHINQETRETNYLHEFIKQSALSSSSSQKNTEHDKNINDNSNETKENAKQTQEEVKATDESNSKQQQQEERSADFIPIGTEPKILSNTVKTEEKSHEALKPNITKEENDSDVEKEIENDAEEVRDEEDFLDKPKENNITSTETTTEKPDSIDVPKERNIVEEVPILTTPSTIENAKQTLDKSGKNIDDKSEMIQKLEDSQDTEIPIKNDENIEEVIENNLTEKISDQEFEKVQEKAKDDTEELKEEVKVKEIFKTQEEEKREVPDPAPVTEEIVEDIQLIENNTITENAKIDEIVETSTEHEKPEILQPEKIIQNSQNDIITNEISENNEEMKSNQPEETKSEEIPKLPEIEIDFQETTNFPEVSIELTTPIPTDFKKEVLENQGNTLDEVPQVEEKHEKKFEEDMLLKRFNEKLGNRGSFEKVVNVKQIQKDQNQHHHFDHGHELHSHSHEGVIDSDDMSQKQLDSDKIIDKLQIEDKQEEDTRAGFLGEIMKKIFGSEKDQQKNNELPSDSSSFESMDEGFCEKIDSENCPKSLRNVNPNVNKEKMITNWMSSDEYIKIAMHEAVERMDLIISMTLVALTVLIFTFGHYCINKTRKEGPLIAKMNDLERHLMASVKENETLKGEIVVTKQKLMSIEDNSFGSNDMVIALKNDLESSEKEKLEMQEKIFSLEKELEAAAEDGLELNRMVSELLNSQSGSDSIISSVEDLQRQLNEQQETIVTMNETLAAKSRENTELQIQLAEINGKCNDELEKLQQNFDALTLERNNLQIELENLKRESDMQVNQIIEERNGEVTRLNNELTSYAGKYDESKKLLNIAESKVQALEECVETFKKNKGGGGDIKALLDVADLKADLLAVTKEKSTIQEQLQSERDSRKLLEDRVKTISEEMSNLKKEFVTADKEKLEAQTRLEVLSTYFKEKETQLQQELSVKEARWMKQQGEKTSTVEKIQSLNDEIQNLKSQNDALRAEIEAQAAAHKLNISATEAQAHTAWLNARQAERKLEESRMEAAALRRRLTSIAENPSGASELLNGLPGMTNDSINSIPSPIRVESPNNVNQMPPGPPLMIPPPFLPGAPPFLPPFLPPPGELPHMGMGMGMPPPLGRLMSPPPKRFTPTMRDDRDRYSPRETRRYSPDSRYDDDYTAFETETDYSPPRTPTPPRRGYSSPTDRSKKTKGGHSSGDSNQPSRRK